MNENAGQAVAGEVTLRHVDLPQVAEELSREAMISSGGRASRMVVHGEFQRAVLLVFDEGARLAEHESPKAATVQVVSGEIEFAAAEQTWILPAGTIVAVPAERHSLVARQHSVVLLTVAL